MKVTMVSTMAGPQGVARRGRVLDIEEKDAKVLVDGGYARKYEHEKDRNSPVGFVKAEDAK